MSWKLLNTIGFSRLDLSKFLHLVIGIAGLFRPEEVGEKPAQVQRQLFRQLGRGVLNEFT